jgi:hypothetical protein
MTTANSIDGRLWRVIPSVSVDPNTPASVPQAKERIDYLIDCLSNVGEKIIVPTPALSECLVHAGPAGAGYLSILSKNAAFRVASFDERAAIEAAIRTFEARARGQRKGGAPSASNPRSSSIVRLSRLQPSRAPLLSIRMTTMFAHTRAKPECSPFA